jgi:hypothetical protein
MRRLLLALAALSVIVGGCRYAYGRESLRRADLGAWYQEDNAKYFGGELQPTHVRWGDLRAENAVGMTRTTGVQLPTDSAGPRCATNRSGRARRFESRRVPRCDI